jgi:hypothetical protein
VSLSDGDVSVVTYPAYPATTVEAREALIRAVQAVKEGREISGESLVVLQSIFSDLAEGHEYVMRAVEVMGSLLSVDESGYDDDDDDEEDSVRAVDTVGSFVSWNSAGGRARGKIERVIREGSLDVPNTDFTINAEEDDPAVLIRVYREVRDGWEPTDTVVGHKSSTLTLIDPLPAPSEEQSRKISLRLAKAIINQTI